MALCCAPPRPKSRGGSGSRVTVAGGSAGFTSACGMISLFRNRYLRRLPAAFFSATFGNDGGAGLGFTGSGPASSLVSFPLHLPSIPHQSPLHPTQSISSEEQINPSPLNPNTPSLILKSPTSRRETIHPHPPHTKTIVFQPLPLPLPTPIPSQINPKLLSPQNLLMRV